MTTPNDRDANQPQVLCCYEADLADFQKMADKLATLRIQLDYLDRAWKRVFEICPAGPSDNHPEHVDHVVQSHYAPAVKVMCLRLMMHPPGAGKKRIYEGRGLKCRRKETGIYLVRRKDKRPFDNFPIQVRLLDPWSGETIDTISPKTEHTTKTEDGEDCERVSEVNFEIGEVPRWYVMVRVLDRFSAMVRLYELPELSKAQRKKVQHKYHAQLSDRAGFCLITHQLGEIDGKR